MDSLKSSYSFFTSTNENDDIDVEAAEEENLIDVTKNSKDEEQKSSWIIEKFNEMFTLSWAQRMALFGMSFAAGIVMLSLSFMYVSMVFVGSPGKFAVTYSLANIFLILSSCFLVGPSKQVKSMFDKNRFIASLIYLFSLFGTLYCAWQLNSVFLLTPMLIIQFGSLIWYVASYFPYGRSCLSSISSGVTGMIFRRSIGSL